MKIISNSLRVRKFRITEPEKIPAFENILSRVEGYSFDLVDKNNGLDNKDITLQPVYEYTEKVTTSSDILINDFMVLVYCVCKKNVSATEIDLEIKRRIKEILEAEPNKDPKSLAKALKKTVVEELRMKKDLVFNLKPFILNIKTGEGVAFNCTETDLVDIMDYVGMLVGNGVEIEQVPFFEDLGFLKWLWYRMENNPSKPVENAEVVPLGIVDVINSELSEKLKSESDSLEEARLSLIRGLYPCKIGVGFVHNGSITKVIFDGTMTATVKPELAGFKDTEIAHYLDIWDTLEELGGFIKILEEEYKNEALTETQIQSWARGDFCIRNYEGL